MEKHRIGISRALGIIVAGLAAGCGTDGAPRPGRGTIVLTTAVDMRDVNELTAPATQVHDLLHQRAFFLPLAEEQPDYEEGPPSFKPRLAESWERSGDQKTLTFHLRRDVVWSDGVPVTAADVRWTWEAQTSPEVAWSLADTKKLVRDVEVVDEHTVSFHFARPYATQMLDVLTGATLPRHVWGRLPFAEWRERSGWFRDHLVVNGPYTLESWEPAQRIVLKRNERYYEPGLPRAERVVVRIVPDRGAQLAMLHAGEAHMIDWARPGDAAALAEDPQIELLSFLPRAFYGLSWNVARPLFASPKVRRALTLGIDRQAIVDAAWHGYARVSTSPYGSGTWVRNRDLEPWPYDPERARGLLAEEGWSDSDGDGVLDKDGEPFRFEIQAPAVNELFQDVVVMVQEQLRRIGVAVEQRALELHTALAREVAHDYEASLVGLAIPTNLDLYYFFHTDAADGGMNFGGYSNPEVDRLIEELREQGDQFAAKPLFDRLQVLLHEDLPITFLFEPRRLIPVRKELRGARPNALSSYFDLHKWELVANGSS